MKALKPLFGLLILLIAFSCGDDGGIPDPSTPPTETSAKVNGQEVTFSNSDSFAVGQKIALSMSSSDYSVNVYLDDKVSGVYAVQASEPGRTKGSKVAYVRVIKNNVQFDGVSGSFDIQYFAGKISGTFSFKVTNGTTNLDFTEGTLPEFTVEIPQNGYCYLTAGGNAYMTDSKSIVTCVTTEFVDNTVSGTGDWQNDKTWFVNLFYDTDPSIIGAAFGRSLSDVNSVYVEYDLNENNDTWDPSVTVTKSGKVFTFSGSLENLDENRITISGTCGCNE